MRIRKPLSIALVASVTVLSGCYVVPMNPDGSPAWPPGVVWGPGSSPASGTAAGQPVQQPASAATLRAKLYPANDLATQTGVVTGTVTNMMSGKGRFLLDYRGELLSGEATRVSGDQRKGVASAYSPAGSYMSCEYQMSTPYQGAGTCTFSNGARYQVHIGN